MSASLGQTIVLYSVGVAVICAACAVVGRRRPVLVDPALVVLETALLVQGLLDAAALLRGDHGPEVATNLGYLLTSLAVLPVTAGALRMDAGRWGSAGLTVACLLLVVVVVRLHATLGTTHA